MLNECGCLAKDYEKKHEEDQKYLQDLKCDTSALGVKLEHAIQR